MASVTSPVRPDGDDAASIVDWTFTRRPFWVFSHVVALSVVVLFVGLGFWQLSRHDERQTANVDVAARLASTAVVVNGSSDFGGPPSQLDYRPATIWGTFVEADYVRVTNRSQGGVAGEHVVGVLELADGLLVAVNRGFVPANAEVELEAVPTGRSPVEGWLRASIAKGRFGVDDQGEGPLVPRMNTDDLAARLGRPVAPVWLQVADTADAGAASTASFPDPVPLPELDAGPHLGYAAQWFVFAVLGVGFYGALLRRQSRTR